MSVTELLRPPQGDGHLLLLHASEDERRAGLSAWVRQGLERDEKVIYTERRDEPEVSAMLSLLRDHGVDGESATREGRLQWLAPEDFYPPGGWVDLAQQALGCGFHRVRVTGDARTALRLMSRRHHLELEQAATDVCRTAPVSILCPYDQDSTPTRHLDAIVATHLEGIHESQLRTRRRADGLTVSGEIDLQNEALFELALRAAVTRTMDSVLVLDLGQVTFMSVGGARAMARTTREFREGGGVLRLLSPPSTVEWLLRTLRIDRQCGMELVDCPGADLTEALA